MDGAIRIKASRPTFRRGGELFGSAAWVEFALPAWNAKPVKDRIAILAEPVLTIQEQEPDADGPRDWRTLRPFEREILAARLARLAREEMAGEDVELPGEPGPGEQLPHVDLTTGGPLAAIQQSSGVEQQSAHLAHNQGVAGANPASASTNNPESENTGPAGDPAGGAGEPGGSDSESPEAAPAADGASEDAIGSSSDDAGAGETSASDASQASVGGPDPAASSAAEDGGEAASSASSAAPTTPPAGSAKSKRKATSNPSSGS